MIDKNEITTAMAAADSPIMIETNQQLADALKQWKNCPVIGIDTEFVRERTYRADLGLIQLSDGKQVWLVDPLKAGPINAMAELFDDLKVIKVLHAPSEDLDVLLYTTRSCPWPLFDTQIACSMLGQSLQLSYHNTVDWLLNVHIDKGETRSNWLKRPLRPAQLHYAALDVCLLPMMYRELDEQLKTIGRFDWLQEDCGRLISKSRTPVEPAESWMKIGGASRLNQPSLVALQALAQWRELEADRRNMAKGFVIKNPELLALADTAPKSISELSSINDLHHRTIDRYGEKLLRIISGALQSDTKIQPLATISLQQKQLLADMKKRVSNKAEELQVEPALLASRRELENLILTDAEEPLPERFMGWRKDIITNELIELMEKYG